MAVIEFQNAGIEFPIYNASTRSLKKKLFQVATGGQINTDDHGRVAVKALQNLNFKFGDGDRVGLLGHNGAGKTTLLRMLSSVYKPTSGRVVIDGQVGSLISISLGIDPESTGRENIFVRGALLGLKKAAIESRIEEIIEFSELGDFIDMPVRTYSSGMHLRLAFAVSTIVRPQILLMDEWLSVGDEGFKEKSEKRLNEVVDATNILVIATHSKNLLLRICNKAIWLEHGQIKMQGTAHDVANSYFK